MGKLTDALNALQGNPDATDTIPAIVAMASEMEANEQAYQGRIETLLNSNRSLLAQIPIPSEEVVEEEEEEEIGWEDVGQIFTELLNK